MRSLRLGLTLVVALAALAGCEHAAEAPPVVRPAVFEHPEPYGAGDLDVFPGSVRARVEADLGFRVPGKISARKADLGATVKAGQILATLDPEDSQLNVEAARTAVAAAEADANLAHSELKRNQDLLAKGFVSQSVVDARENAVKLTDARLDEARARLALVKNQSGYTQLKADRDGVITAVLAEAGQVVAAGQPVFRVAAQGAREVVINVPEGQVERVAHADDLALSLWAQPKKRYHGRVREVSPQADPATRTHEVRITLTDADAAVKLGMTASVFVNAKSTGDVFKLPLSAVGDAKQPPAVWRVENDKVKRVPIEVVRYIEDAVVVRGALSPDDKIVAAGVHLLVEGQSVRPVPRTRAAAP
jgi:multidrug efflux system membrane fusion protein